MLKGMAYIAAISVGQAVHLSDVAGGVHTDGHDLVFIEAQPVAPCTQFWFVRTGAT